MLDLFRIEIRISNRYNHVISAFFHSTSQYTAIYIVPYKQIVDVYFFKFRFLRVRFQKKQNFSRHLFHPLNIIPSIIYYTSFYIMPIISTLLYFLFSKMSYIWQKYETIVKKQDNHRHTFRSTISGVTVASKS